MVQKTEMSAKIVGVIKIKKTPINFHPRKNPYMEATKITFWWAPCKDFFLG